MKYLIILLSCMLLLSCNKSSSNVTLKGKVINPVTGKGIQFAELWIQKTSIGSNSNWKTVQKRISNSDGSFIIEKLGLSKYSAVCGKLQDEYYEVGWVQDLGTTFTDNLRIPLKIGKITDADYYAVPYGSLNLNVKNISCFNSSDNLKLYFDGGPYDSKTFALGLMTTLDGCIDIPGIPIKTSMGFKYFHWEVTKNNTTETYYDTVYVEANQTTVFDVNY